MAPARPADSRYPSQVDVEFAARTIRAGGLVAFPTETFYGLGASALDPSAVARVFRAKGRPNDKPLLVLVASLAMVEQVAGEISPRARRLMARHWPGPLTLVLPARVGLPDLLTAGTRTVAVRISSHPVAQALVAAAGLPVTAPSANRHGGAPPRTAAEVRVALGDEIDLVLDGGVTLGGPASTLLDLTRTPPVVLRAGAIVLEAAEILEER